MFHLFPEVSFQVILSWQAGVLLGVKMKKINFKYWVTGSLSQDFQGNDLIFFKKLPE
jgi:hypothetical protein